MMIKPTDIVDFQNKIFPKCSSLAVSKGNDYSGGTKDTFTNIRLASHVGLVSNPAHSCMVRVLDKVMRMINLTGKDVSQQVPDESLNDTLSDLINYACYAVMLDNERRNTIDIKTSITSLIDVTDPYKSITKIKEFIS